MTSSLTWLDYSESDRQRAMEVIDLFRESTTVDELGLASVRDSFADLFFPGTSTVQTRACYFLLVPWTFLRLERLRKSSGEMAERGRKAELKLSDRMRRVKDADTRGVFGGRAGDSLKRLPSEVYWSGLRSWGICTFSGHKWAYFRSLDSFYRRKDEHRLAAPDPEGREAPPANWHPHIPAPPSEFPYKNVSVSLRQKDAEYLRERIRSCHPHSLLAVVAGRADVSDLEVCRPWELSHLTEIDTLMQTRLRDAKLFAVCMQGAALLYNLMLSELKGNEERIEVYRRELGDWAGDADELKKEIAHWKLEKVWRMARDQGRSPAYPMQIFVGRWVDLLLENGSNGIVHKNSTARHLIQERETRLKGGRARLISPRHLELWGGRSGTTRMDYRWGTAKTILQDIFEGLA